MEIYWFYNTYWRDGLGNTYAANYLTLLPLLKIASNTFHYYFCGCYYNNSCSIAPLIISRIFYILLNWILISHFYLLSKGLCIIYNSLSFQDNKDHVLFSIIVFIVDVLLSVSSFFFDLITVTIISDCFTLIFLICILWRLRNTIRLVVYHMNYISSQFIDPLHTVLLNKYNVLKYYRVLLIFYCLFIPIGGIILVYNINIVGYFGQMLYSEITDFIYIGGFLLLFRSRPENPTYSIYPTTSSNTHKLPEVFTCNTSIRNNNYIEKHDLIYITGPGKKSYVGQYPPKIKKMRKTIPLNDSLIIPVNAI